MRRAASPMATADDEHAVEYVRFGPRSPCSMPIHDAAALVIASSTVNGGTRSECCSYTR